MAAQLPPPLESEYIFERRLGSGNFGSVQLYKRNRGGIMVAVKLLERGEKINRDVVREVLNHRQLDHRNIVRFLELRLNATHLAIVMEYAKGGEIFSKLVDNKSGPFSEAQCRWYTQQVVAGLAHMHKHGVAHRDIKLENLVLDGSERGTVKICDLGYSKQLALSQAKTKVGTASYLAPEVVHSREYDGMACDVWAVGVCLHVMVEELAKAYPFNDPRFQNDDRKTVQNLVKYYSNELRYNPPPQASPPCQDLLRKLLHAKANERVTLEEVYNDPWFCTDLPAECMPNAQLASTLPADWGAIQSEEVTKAILAAAQTQENRQGESMNDFDLDDPAMLDYE